MQVLRHGIPGTTSPFPRILLYYQVLTDTASRTRTLTSAALVRTLGSAFSAGSGRLKHEYLDTASFGGVIPPPRELQHAEKTANHLAGGKGGSWKDFCVLPRRIFWTLYGGSEYHVISVLRETVCAAALPMAVSVICSSICGPALRGSTTKRERRTSEV